MKAWQDKQYFALSFLNMILGWFSLCIFMNPQMVEANPKEYLYVNFFQNGRMGMFSVFSYVTGALHKYETGDYAGIEVNFENHGLYYDSEYGPNWWNYYCQPIKIGDCNEKNIIKFNFKNFALLGKFTENQLSREQVFEIIQKYIKVKEHIQEKVTNFIEDNFLDAFIISIHYRGTDKKNEAPRIPYNIVERQVRNYIQENELENYKIFVATDEQQFIDYMKKAFPGLIVHYDAKRSTNGRPLHIKTDDQYNQGEEALIDCLLLSQGDVLFRTSSNLSLWSTFFNPEIPTIELTKRFRHPSAHRRRF